MNRALLSVSLAAAAAAHPIGPGPRPPTPDAPFRAGAPPPSGTVDLRLPAAQRVVLDNGLTILLVEQHQLPIVSLELVVRAGGERNPPEAPGLAGLTARMLDEGTTTRDALGIADAAAALGGQISTDAGWDAAYVGISVLRPHLPGAVELLADVALRPTFPDAELPRIRDDVLTDLLRLRDDPHQMASTALAAVLYGPRHPYGYPSVGVEESVKRFTRDDLQAFYRAHWRPEQAALIVVGDVKLAELQERLAKNLAAWPRGDGAAAELPAPETRAGRAFVVDKPGAAQSVVMLGHVGVPRSSPDYVPILVMNRILGGQFASRINMNLREQHGYTYGARSTFDFRRGPGPFWAGGGIRTDVTDKAVVELRKEIAGIRDADATPAELDLARDGVVRSMPGRYETTARVARELSEIFLHDLPLDWLTTLADKVRAVTAADVRRVAQQYLQPDRMVLVVAGDRAKVEPGLGALGMGAVQRVDAFGNAAP